MTNLYWLNEDQMARLRPYFPRCHSVPRVDNRRDLSQSAPHCYQPAVKKGRGLFDPMV